MESSVSDPFHFDTDPDQKYNYTYFLYNLFTEKKVFLIYFFYEIWLVFFIWPDPGVENETDQDPKHWINHTSIHKVFRHKPCLGVHQWWNFLWVQS